MTDRTAQRFMDVAGSFGVTFDTVSDLTATILYTLATPSTSDYVREEFVKEAEAQGHR